MPICCKLCTLMLNYGTLAEKLCILPQQRQVCISNNSGVHGNDLFDPKPSLELLSPFCRSAGRIKAAKAPSRRPSIIASPCWAAQLFPTDETVDQQESSCRAGHQYFAHSFPNQQWRHRLSGTMQGNQTIGTLLCHRICQQSLRICCQKPTYLLVPG